MNSKFTALIFLGLIVLSTCKFFSEKTLQGYIDKMADGKMKRILKAVVHKGGKNEFGCLANYDTVGACGEHCKGEDKIGVCHGMKCKCGVPLSYRALLDDY
uniref:CSab-Cer-6 n=1 Tax=Cercophonius squama TaxID=1330404 RepID=T1DMR0_9SCOR